MGEIFSVGGQRGIGRYRGANSNQKILGIQTGAVLDVLTKETKGAAPVGWTKNIDIDSYSFGAVISLVNGSGTTQFITDVTIKGKAVIQLQGDEGYLHDSFEDQNDVYENGERTVEWGNDFVVTFSQVNDIADFLWKEFRRKDHLYVLDLPGTRYDFEPGDWYNLTIGGAGEIEFLDSAVRIFSVETARNAGELGSTRLMLREVQEAWKQDSNAAARFQASGSITHSPLGPIITIGSQYFPGVADVYCDGTSDQEEINAIAAMLSETYDGGTIHLAKGTFNTSGSILPKDNIRIEGEGDQTIIKFTMPSGWAIDANLKTNVQLANFNIEASGGTPDGTIFLNESHDSRIENLTIKAAAVGAFVGGSDRVIISKLNFNSGAVDVTFMLRLSLCDDMNISDCVFNGNGNSGITPIVFNSDNSNMVNVFVTNFLNDTDADMSAINITGGGNNISNCRIENITSDFTARIARGFYITGDDNRFANCYITDIDSDDTAANSRGVEITGDNNEMAGFGVTLCSGKGIKIGAGATNTIVNDCVSRDNGADSGIDNTNEDNFSDAGTNTFVG